MPDLTACMSEHDMCVCCLDRPEEGRSNAGTGVPDGGELPRGCWGLSIDSLQEQVILVTKTFLEPHRLILIVNCH